MNKLDSFLFTGNVQLKFIENNVLTFFWQYILIPKNIGRWFGQSVYVLLLVLMLEMLSCTSATQMALNLEFCAFILKKFLLHSCILFQYKLQDYVHAFTTKQDLNLWFGLLLFDKPGTQIINKGFITYHSNEWLISI